MATFLSHQGYSIVTNEYDASDIDAIKKELTVSPYVMEDFAFGNIPKYKLYEEGPTKLYVPKYYGLCKFGKPDVNRLSEGVDISVPFLGSLRSEQLEPVKAFLKACEDPEKMGGLLNLSCASGKTTLSASLQRKQLSSYIRTFSWSNGRSESPSLPRMLVSARLKQK